MIRLRNTSNRTQRRQRSHNTAVETLEGRTLLSGDVAATQVGTTLLLEGDTAGNWIKVYSGLLPHEVDVVGENYTTVNHGYQTRRFYGIESVSASMDGGNDSFKAINLCLSTITTGPMLSVDGGNGDDSILVQDSSIHAEGDPSQNVATLRMTGDALDSTSTPTTGNDCIQVCGTTVSAEGGDQASVDFEIAGESNNGGQVTCGNDNITVSNSCVVASDALDNTAALFIDGDQNIATDDTSTIGVGDDDISVSCTDVKATGGLTTNSDTVFVEIVGDDNSASGLNSVASIGSGNDTISVTGSTISTSGGTINNTGLIEQAQLFNRPVDILGDRNFASDGGTATIGGGNDCISVCNTTVSACGGSFSNDSNFDIEGDNNFTNTGVATICGGNDHISVDSVCVTASGTLTLENTAQFRIFGDGNYNLTNAANFASTGGGNDTISLTISRVTATGNPFNDFASAVIVGDDQVAASGPGIPVSVAAQGNDCIRVQCLTVQAETLAILRVQAGVGDDFVDIRDSTWGQTVFSGDEGCDEFWVVNNNFDIAENVNMGDGNDQLHFLCNTFVDASAVGITMGNGDDALWFTGNTFVTAHADGGLGFDRLYFSDNSGLFTFSNFEEVNGAPYP